MENYQQNPQDGNLSKSNVSEELKSFYKGEFKTVISSMFTKPIDGTYSIFKNPSKKAYTHSIILLVSLFVVTFLCIYIGLGDARSYFDTGLLIKLSLLPVIVAFMMTVLSFAIKSANGKSDFKNELQIGRAHV